MPGRPRYHLMVGQFPRLDLSDVREVAHGRAAAVSMTWKSGIVVRVEPRNDALLRRCLRLDVQAPANSCYRSAEVRLRRRPCPRGERYAFQCPGCERVCETLFIRWGLFRCRICAKLRYQSQARDPLSRQHDAIARLRRKLDADDEKPKLMRWRTYEAILTELHARQQRLDLTWLSYMPKRLLRTLIRP